MWAKWKPRAPFIWSSRKPGEMMAFLRLIISVFGGRGELGIMRPEEEIVRGEVMSEPLMHWRQFMNCFGEVMLKFNALTLKLIYI